MRLSAAIAGMTALFILTSDANAQWVNSSGTSCDVACSRVGRPAARSGIYVNGRPFFICAGNAANEGFRAGYNLRPSWARACIVGWGGRELPVNPFKCLCAPIGRAG